MMYGFSAVQKDPASPPGLLFFIQRRAAVSYTHLDVYKRQIYAREQLRLRMSLEAARKDGYERIIVAMHYPPAEMKNSRNEFTEIIGEFEPELVIYGHLHGSYARQFSFNGRIGATDYRLVSCDYLGFVPILAAQTKESRGGILCQEGKLSLIHI